MNQAVGPAFIVSSEGAPSRYNSGPGSIESNVPLEWLCQKSTEIDTIFASTFDKNSPGVAVLVAKDAAVLHKKGYGLANLESKSPITPGTRFSLASITKQFTALTIAMLVERNYLGYDDRLTKFFPTFKYAHNVTISHLLYHTSGLQDYEELLLERGKIKDNYPRAREPLRSDFEPSSADIMNLLEGERLRFIPGKRWEYSNSGYVALAQIVERVSGESFPEFVNNNIFVPLAMSNSIVDDGQGQALEGLARSYSFEEDHQDIDYTPLNAVYGQSNIYSTLDDLAKWYEAIGSEKLVSRDTMKKAFTSGKLSDGTDVHYGFGWFLGSPLGLMTASHTGSWVGLRHSVVYYPDFRFVVLVLSNCRSRFDDVSRSYLLGKLAKLYLSDLMNIPSEVSVESKVLMQYLGRYEFQDGECVDITTREATLWAESDRRGPMNLAAKSQANFFVVGAEADSYQFQRNSNGLVEGLVRYLSVFGNARDAFAKAKKLS